MKRLLYSLFVLCVTFSSFASWRHDLWLGRSGWWPQRVRVALVNQSTNALHEASFPLEIPALKAAPASSVRVVDGDGTELMYALTAPGSFVVPVTLPPRGAAVYAFYAGNTSAWALADSWNVKPNPQLPVAVVVGEKESLNLREVGQDEPWPTDSTWDYRVPVRLLNDTDAAFAHAQATVPAAEVLRATRNPQWSLRAGKREIPCAVMGATCFFSTDVPAKSVKTVWFYVKSRAHVARVPDAVTLDGLASDIPSDPRAHVKARLDDSFRRDFGRVLAEGVNLVQNGLFTAGESSWRLTRSGAPDVKYSIVDGGLFGGKCALLKCLPGPSAKIWKGRCQAVPVKPGHTYAYGAFVRATNTSSRVAIHVHGTTAQGRDVMGAALGTGRTTPSLPIGGAPWTPLFGTITVASDIRALQLHLTHDGVGEIWHDGVFVFESVSTVLVGDPEPAPVPSNAFRVAPTSPIEKVFPETCVPAVSKPLAVSLARNETEDLQLAVCAGQACTVTFGVEDLRHASLAAQLAVETLVVGLVPVDWPTAYYSCHVGNDVLRRPLNGGACDGFTGWWPDPVVATNTLVLPAFQARAVRLSFSTTAQTPAGVYRGAVVWRSADGRELRRDPLSVTVWNFDIPARPAFAATYDVRFTSNQRDAWKLPGEKDLEPARKRVLDFMAKYKICPDGIKASPSFKRLPDGSVKANFASYDREAALYFDHYKFPNAYMPSVFNLFGWAHPPRVFLGVKPYDGDAPYRGVNRSELRAEYKKVFQATLRLYWDHVKARGWDRKLVYYISDEPYMDEEPIRSQMIALCKMIHEVDPAIRIYSSTWRHCPDWDDSLDIWGVGAHGCFPVAEMKRLSDAGHEIWFTTDGQQCLDTPLCAIERLQPLYCWAYGAKKYEFWGCNWLTYDPWKFGWHSYIRQSSRPGEMYWVRYPNGDGYHIYPPLPGSKTGTPEPSLRLCAIRDGVEEFSYWEMLSSFAKNQTIPPAKRAQAEKLCQACRALVPIPNAGGRYSTQILPDPAVLDDLRQQVGDFLAAMQ